MRSFSEFTDHTQVVSSQRSTEFVLSVLGLDHEQMVGERILDLGSGYRQQLAQDLEMDGTEVISLDPNLPHTDSYVFNQLRI